MTKQNIVNTVSEATGLTKVETEAVMNGVMSTIIESLGRNERVELRGFGTFGVKHRKPKKAQSILLTILFEYPSPIGVTLNLQ